MNEDKMNRMRKVWKCPNNDTGNHEGSGFQIATYEEPPLCSFCGSKLKEDKSSDNQ